MSNRISAPSAHDVARIAGVSQAAVSRAFTPGASIAKATREKVFRAAESLGYRPNLIARSLIKGESGIVGVVIGNPMSPTSMSALDALSALLSAAGKHILVFTADGSSAVDVHVEDLLRYRVDAVLLLTTIVSTTLAERCQAEGVPIISFNRPPRGSKFFASVTGDNRGGAKCTAEHLLQQGYRRFGLIAGYSESSTSRDRESGFTSFLVSQGLPQPEREVGHYKREGALLAARKLLARKPRPDALFCANDHMALAAIDVARYEFGLEIGRDVGIAGFDNIDEASWPGYELTTYSLPVETMIEKVVAMLLTRTPRKSPGHTTVEGHFIPRNSTRRTRK